jgi:hypothetical protein
VALRKADPLAQNAETWDKQSAGAPCRVCRVNVTLGHRYYNEGEKVVHYSCLADEEAKIESLF